MVKKRPALHLAGSVALACALALGGCGLFGPSAEQIVREGLEADLDVMLDADSQAHQAMVSNLEASGALTGLGVDSDGLVDALLDGFEYKIDEVDVDEDAGTAVATVDVTCKSLGDISARAQELMNQRMADADAGAMAQEETLGWMGECLMQAAREDEPKASQLALNCSRDAEDVWSADDSVSDAIASALLN